MSRHVTVGIMVAVLAVTAAGCGQGRDTLTVYSGRSEALVEPIIERFRESTEIKVAVRYASTLELATTLLEEGRRSPADIFFAQDPGGLGVVEEMFAPLPDQILSRVPEWGRSPEGAWVGISGRARTVVYNTERLTEANELETDDIAAAMFTTTVDLNAEFPALAARKMGWEYVALLDSHEMRVPDALTQCIRVLILVNTDKAPQELTNVYLRGATNLRDRGIREV